MKEIRGVKTLTCAKCGVEYVKEDGVEMYNVGGRVLDEMCREEEEECS